MADEADSLDAERAAPRLDMSHGFVNRIRRNQQERDVYDKEQRAQTVAMRLNKQMQKTTRQKRPERQLYTPPRRSGDSSRSTSVRSQSKAAAAAAAAPAEDAILLMEVEVQPGKWVKFHVLHSDTAEAVAKRIAREHDLEPRLAAALAYHIAIEMQTV